MAFKHFLIHRSDRHKLRQKPVGHGATEDGEERLSLPHVQATGHCDTNSFISGTP